MNRSGSLRNKLVYLAVIIVMLLPLYLLGQPATGRAGGSAGQLAQMRSELHLAEANLGEIDPASESMKLASLGLRGVAATLLSHKAEEFKRLHEWDRFSATLNQIAKLQPHYEKVWEHQAHNLAYNISVEFDDYRQRYAWIKKGMDFLTEGVHLNRRAPRLVWYTGWFYGNKIGMSDEKTQFRELFRNDDPLHQNLVEEGIPVDKARGPEGLPDNWLVGRLWMMRGYDLVDGGVPLVDKTPVTFYEYGPKMRIEHAAAIESEGILDARSKEAWERAADDWYGYGTRPLATSRGYTVKLAGIGDLHERREDAIERLKALAGDEMKAVEEQRRKSLTDEEREALDTPEAERSEDQVHLAEIAQRKLEPSFQKIAKQVARGDQLKALQLAGEIAEIDEYISMTDIYRRQMNYAYWELRCLAEQDDLMIEARRLLHDAHLLYQKSDLDAEIAKYEQAFAKWRQVFDQYPGLVVNTGSDELVDAIERYRVATDQADLPEDFPLKAYYYLQTEVQGPTPTKYQELVAEEAKAATEPSIDILKPFTGTTSESESRSDEVQAVEETPVEDQASEDQASEETPPAGS